MTSNEGEKEQQPEQQEKISVLDRLKRLLQNVKFKANISPNCEENKGGDEEIKSEPDKDVEEPPTEESPHDHCAETNSSEVTEGTTATECATASTHEKRYSVCIHETRQMAIRRFFRSVLGKLTGRRPSEGTTGVLQIRKPCFAAHHSLNLSTKKLSSPDKLDKVLRLQEHPEEILEIVLCGNPTLRALPISIGLFENLSALVLQGNGLRELPWSIVYLRSLRLLDLAHNALETLPRTVGYLRSLEVLDLEGNHLTHLPRDLVMLTKLKSLNLQNNPRFMFTGCFSEDLQTLSVQTVFAELRKRQKRRNLWEDSRPWVSDNSCSNDTCWDVKSLFQISLDSILQHRVDFLGCQSVPHSVRQFLNEKQSEYATKVTVAKCSRCRGFFSCRETFETHFCRS